MAKRDVLLARRPSTLLFDKKEDNHLIMASKYENNARKPKGAPRPLRLGPPRDDDTHAVWWLWRRRKSRDRDRGPGLVRHVTTLSTASAKRAPRACLNGPLPAAGAAHALSTAGQPSEQRRRRRREREVIVLGRPPSQAPPCSGSGACSQRSEAAHVPDEWASPYKRRRSRGCCAAAGT